MGGQRRHGGGLCSTKPAENTWTSFAPRLVLFFRARLSHRCSILFLSFVFFFSPQTMRTQWTTGWEREDARQDDVGDLEDIVSEQRRHFYPQHDIRLNYDALELNAVRRY